MGLFESVVVSPQNIYVNGSSLRILPSFRYAGAYGHYASDDKMYQYRLLQIALS